MAEYYLDVSAVGNEYQAYAATPTWGALATDKPLPMDGNGLGGPGHAAAVAIAEIKVNALPADTNTLVIAGAVITAKTTVAAKNQFAIGASISACVTNIVNLLNTYGTGNNQCDATASSGASAALLPLPYFLFARVKPGTTDTVQIATRIAGSTLNQAINSSMGISHSGWGTAPTFTQFAGGADGPFAYLIWDQTIFGKTIGTYGLFTLGNPATPSINVATDVVHMRSKRGGSNLSVTFSHSTAGLTLTHLQCNYLADNGTVWAGDNGTLTLNVVNTYSSGTPFSLNVNASNQVNIASSGYRNFDVSVYATNANGGFMLFRINGTGASVSFVRSGFLEALGNAGSGLWLCGAGGSALTGIRVDVTGSFLRSRSVARTYLSCVLASGGGIYFKANGLVHEVVSATTNIGGFIGSTGVATGTVKVDYCGGAVYDTNGVYSCATPLILNSVLANLEAVIDNVAGIADVASGITVTYPSRIKLWWNQSEGPVRAFRCEDTGSVVDWKNDGTFPECGALNLQGDAWSQRVTWGAIPTFGSGFSAIKSTKFYRSAAAVKTLTLQLYVPNATTIYLDELDVVVRYIDSSGVSRNQALGDVPLLQLLASGRTALSSSAKSWNANGVSSYSAKKLALTTDYAIKQNTEIALYLTLRASRSPSMVFYVSPELELS